MSDAARDPAPLTLVVMGVSGVGKTSVAHALVERTGWAFQEGDDLHPEANRAKMAAGTPLTDDDRWPWLRLIAAWIGEQEAAGHGAVVTCSALREESCARGSEPGVVDEPRPGCPVERLPPLAVPNAGPRETRIELRA